MSRFIIACLYTDFVTKKRILKINAKLLFALATLLTTPGYAAINHFLHIVVVFQENRTPDNLFWHLCDVPNACDPTGQTANTFNIATSDWLDDNASNGTINPLPVLLSNCDQDSIDGKNMTNCWDPEHHHSDFLAMCDKDPYTGACKMDGASNEACHDNVKGAKCESLKASGQFPFFYVDDLATIQPYLDLATEYGWANYMFETNEGPSFPAHQFIFGASSAPSPPDDANGNFAAENMSCGTTYDGQSNCAAGCVAIQGTTVSIADAFGDELTSQYPCFERKTLSDLLESKNVSWRYYANSEGALWNAPNAINHICGGSQLTHCTGSDFTSHVVLDPRQVLIDIRNCELANVSWVTPDGSFSDHPGGGSGGPDWVASVVNAVGNSQCTDGGTQGPTYWKDTAIVVTWDDWGAWYDHVAPQIKSYPWGGYQYGFRVPLIFVSAYGVNNNGGSGCQPSTNNEQLDFGSVARFIEGNFSLGSLGFADARSVNDLSGFYTVSQSPCTFISVPTHRDGGWFLTHKLPPTPPDTD